MGNSEATLLDGGKANLGLVRSQRVRAAVPALFSDFKSDILRASASAAMCDLGCRVEFKVLTRVKGGAQLLPFTWKLGRGVCVCIEQHFEDPNVKPNKVVTSIAGFYFLNGCIVELQQSAGALGEVGRVHNDCFVEDDTECPVCLDRNVSVVLSCSHSFCVECWDEWAAEKRTSNDQASCPLCRTETANSKNDPWVLTESGLTAAELEEVRLRVSTLRTQILEFIHVLPSLSSFESTGGNGDVSAGPKSELPQKEAAPTLAVSAPPQERLLSANSVPSAPSQLPLRHASSPSTHRSHEENFGASHEGGTLQRSVSDIRAAVSSSALSMTVRCPCGTLMHVPKQRGGIGHAPRFKCPGCGAVLTTPVRTFARTLSWEQQNTPLWPDSAPNVWAGPSADPSTQGRSLSTWRCSACTFDNPHSVPTCVMCSTASPEQQEEDDLRRALSASLASYRCHSDTSVPTFGT